jgi:hypothetical protein
MNLSNELQSISILPELVLSAVGIIIMLADPLMGHRSSQLLPGRPPGKLVLQRCPR